jgi:non-homologous end joining protein Ku
MLEAKLAGQPVARPEPTPEAPVVDLMEALRASVAAAKKKPAAKKPPARQKKAAARRP